MKKRIPTITIAFVLTWLAAALNACSPDASRTPPIPLANLGSQSSRGCRTPDIPQMLRDGICSEDLDQMRNALSSLRDVQSQEERKRVLQALKRIWLVDKTYGSEMPWEFLSQPSSRAVIGGALAQSYRNGEAELDLDEIRTFAVKIAGTSDDIDFDGVLLLGMANAEDQVSKLRLMALADDPSARRQTAIVALGMICGVDAENALNEVRVASNQDARVRRAVDFASESRRNFEKSWCAK